MTPRASRPRRRIAIAAAALVASGGAASGALGAPGDLDRSFGGGTGRAVIGFPGSSETADAMALRPDGRIVLAGFTTVSGADQDFAVARVLSPQGTLDPSYGGGTGLSLGGFGATRNDDAGALALQPDGRIVVAGTSRAVGGSAFAVARLLDPEGTFDPSYGGGSGRSLAEFAPNTVNEASDVALQPDGRIVVAGTSSAGGSADFAVARLLNPQGTFDPSFGGGTGRSLPGFAPGSIDFGRALALQPDGRILVAGSSNAGGTADFAVARVLEPEGTFDPSFGEAGRSLLRFGAGSAESAEAMALQPDGRVILAGVSNAAGDDDFAVARLLRDGTPDPSFGERGTALVGFGAASEDGATAAAVQPDGKIVLAGASAGDVAVVRLQPNGTPDTTFGTGGKVTVDLGSNDDVARAVALQPDGRIVVAGSTTATGYFDMAVVRLEGDPGPGGPGGPGRPAGRPAVVTCAGARATIVGTAAADRLRGTRRADVIVGLGGNDRISALGGGDLVCAGPGDDLVSGGAGDDRLRGERGRDRLLGGPGRDRMFGGAGRDRLLGGAGRDRERP